MSYMPVYEYDANADRLCRRAAPKDEVQYLYNIDRGMHRTDLHNLARRDLVYCKSKKGEFGESIGNNVASTQSRANDLESSKVEGQDGIRVQLPSAPS
jgi:hypothetical protein